MSTERGKDDDDVIVKGACERREREKERGARREEGKGEKRSKHRDRGKKRDGRSLLRIAANGARVCVRED